MYKLLKNVSLSNTHKLSLADRRLYNYLLLNSLNSLKNCQDGFAIKFADLIGVYGVGLPQPEQLIQSLMKLTSIIIHATLKDDSSEQYLMTGLLAEARINLTNNTVMYNFSKTATIFLTNPIYLEQCLIQAHFNYKYTPQLYTLLANVFFNRTNEYTTSVTDLREFLGIENKKLINFNDLHRFVLHPALREINSHASFAVDFDIIRKRRLITHLKFTMHEKYCIDGQECLQSVIPPRRPKLFIENPLDELSYAYLLNTNTTDRQKWFNLALKKSRKTNVKINADELDRPDLWFRLILNELAEFIG